MLLLDFVSSGCHNSIAVCLMSFFAINALEDMRARLIFLCSKPWWFWLIIFFVVSHFLPIMLGIVRSIIFDVSEYLGLPTEYCIALFPIVLTLWNSGIHVCTINGSNILSDIKTIDLAVVLFCEFQMLT